MSVAAAISAPIAYIKVVAVKKSCASGVGRAFSSIEKWKTRTLFEQHHSFV